MTPTIATAISTVSTTVEFNGDNIIISAGTEDRLRAYMEFIHEQVGEIRQTGVVVGPLVAIQPISPGLKAAKAFAEYLDTRQMGAEITKVEAMEAKRQGLVVVFGYSDDCTEFRGAINDEVGLGQLDITTKGRLMTDFQKDALESLRADGMVIEIETRSITATYGEQGHSYKTDIPHATFDVMEDGELFCRGIVFAISDLTK